MLSHFSGRINGQFVIVENEVEDVGEKVEGRVETDGKSYYC